MRKVKNFKDFCEKKRIKCAVETTCAGCVTAFMYGWIVANPASGIMLAVQLAVMIAALLYAVISAMETKMAEKTLQLIEQHPELEDPLSLMKK